jgi:hypothetical protein
MDSHTFDDILGLEEQFYNEGRKQGFSDGVRAGRVEGRTFGLEKGFEKFVESGKLYGRSIVWANRIHQVQTVTNSSNQISQSKSPRQLLPLPDNARLSKHVKILHALAESESLSTENTEESVSEFDDRRKRAQSKAKVIERMVGEVGGVMEDQSKSTGDDSIEDIRLSRS